MTDLFMIIRSIVQVHYFPRKDWTSFSESIPGISQSRFTIKEGKSLHFRILTDEGQFRN